MSGKYLLPLVAISGIGFSIATVLAARRSPPPSKPVVEPASRPSEFRAIAGAGLIEARMENIPIGTTVPGVVVERYVDSNDNVKAGDPLFRIDDRDLKAELKVREANLLAAQAQYERIKAAPQQGDVAVAEAAVAEADAKRRDAEIVAERTERLYQQHVGAASDWERDHYAYQAAQAAWVKAKADLERIRITWEKDKIVSKSQVAQAEALVARIKTDLDRLIVRAPVDGRVLQVNVRLGQFAAMTWKEPLVVLGDLRKLHVRVDIDEQDVPYFQRGLRAVATLKGRPQVRFPLEYVDVEPYVIPKVNLTGSNSDRVDTRVLQVIYALPDNRPIPLYVGQQMDVYLEAAAPPKGIVLEADPQTARRPFEDDVPSSPPKPTLSRPTSAKQ